MKELQLPRGLVALVDDDVWEWARQYRWQLHPRGYVWRKSPLPNGKRGTVRLRREVMHAPPGYEVLHRNGNQLDIRRENLVVLSPSERAAQRSDRLRGEGPRSSNTSGFRGVSWDRERRTWDARIRVSGKQRHLGYYSTAAAAACARDSAARQAWGAKAYQNFGPEGGSESR